jgi:uncharacterized protein
MTSWIQMGIRDWRDAWQRLAGRGMYPHQFAFLLLVPFRNLILPPRELVARLHVTETSRVLELGPGPGFFSVQMARSIPHGHLYLVDLQREMLEKARWRIRRAGFSNASFTQASAMSLPFAPGVFDIAFLVAVLGEVPDPGACIESICRSLRPGGILSITELPGDPDATPESEVVALVCAKGFHRIESFPIRGGFTANFSKPNA